MPVRTINPFAALASSPMHPSEILNEKLGPHSFDTPLDPKKSNNRIAKFFSAPARKRSSDSLGAKSLHPTQTSHAGLRSPPSPGLATLSLPTINLTTATGEKSIPDERPTPLFSPPSPEEVKKLAKQHAAFGPIGSQEHRYSSRFVGDVFPNPIEDTPPMYFLLTTYISYLVLIIFGHVRDFFGKRFRHEHYRHLQARDGWAPLHSDFDNFYIRRLQLRINDCFRRPVTGVPGRYITLLDRKSDDFNLSFTYTGTTTETLNMSSYNYLGFAQSEGECADLVEASIKRYGTSFASTRADAGTSELHVEVEDLIARFVGKDSAMIFSMGFVTNATAFPALVGKGCLIISDELNHSSIRFGARLSGAVIDMFKHNNMDDLERLLRERISQGQPRTHRPWKKILVAVEGLYSMEGTMVNLPGIVELKDSTLR